MESQPKNPEFTKNPENFHPCEIHDLGAEKAQTRLHNCMIHMMNSYLYFNYSTGLYFNYSTGLYFNYSTGLIGSQFIYSKTCLKQPLKKKTKTLSSRDRLMLNEAQKYCRMRGAFCNTFELH